MHGHSYSKRRSAEAEVQIPSQRKAVNLQYPFKIILILQREVSNIVIIHT